MNRATALAWLNGTGFDAAMLEIGRTTDDTITGYGPILHRSFGLHSTMLALPLTYEKVDPQYDLQFSALLEAVAADLISLGYARMVDINVDAPLTGLKLSQAYRQFNELRERKWKEAEFYGYVVASNVGGWAINTDYIEPSATSTHGSDP